MNGDLTIDCRQTAEDNVVSHEEGILTNPIPRGVKVVGLESIEAWLNTLDIGVAVLAGDVIKFGLEGNAVGFFLIKCEFSGTRVTTEVAHIQFDMLSSKLLLVGLEL